MCAAQTLESTFACRWRANKFRMNTARQDGHVTGSSDGGKTNAVGPFIQGPRDRALRSVTLCRCSSALRWGLPQTGAGAHEGAAGLPSITH